MDAGDVELSGAVDFSPNELSEKPKTQEVKNAETTVETASKPASIKEEDVRFYSDKISTSNNDMFVRVEGGERRKRAMKRREERERKEALREAKMAEKREGVSGLVGESEKALKKEQRRLAKEQRKQKRAERRGKILGWLKKHWYIFAGIVVVAALAGGVLLVSHLISEAQKSQAAAEDRNYIDDHETNTLKVFREVAGKTLTRKKIDAILAEYGGNVVVDYYARAGAIHPKDDFSEMISFTISATSKDDNHTFFYNSRIGYDEVYIYDRENGSEFYYKGESKMYGNAEEAIGAYLLSVREAEKNAQ